MGRFRKTIYIVCWLCCLMIPAVNAQSPYVSRIVEYLPAPGQFTNTSGWGTPAKANSLIGGLNGGISLGGFGGYIVVGFDHRIENHPDNPYGIDFTVFGNPLATGQLVTWSEAGAVMVMKDENGNGLPDDTWYELAGSDYYFASSIKNYRITYVNPRQTVAANVPWTDNQGQAGNVLKNEFHLQPYYPRAEVFPNVDQQQISFTGTLLRGYVDRSNPSYIQSYRRGFGYTDNALAGPAAHTVPDNPYTDVVEGAGGDGFDIGWAIDADGNHVLLDGIDFVKVYTTLNEDAGWLGEVSTEVRGVVDVAPNAAITGGLDCVVMADLPVTVDVNTQLELEAYAFRKGIVQPGESLVYTVDNTAAAKVSGNLLTTTAPGSIVVTAALQSSPSIRHQRTIRVAAPARIVIKSESETIRVNGKSEISATVVDQDQRELPGIDLTWKSSNTAVLAVVAQGDKLFIQGHGAGDGWVIVSATHIPDMKDSVLISVIPEAETRYVYVRVKDDDETIIPRSAVAVKNFDLNAYVDRARGLYGIEEVGEVTVAHAIAYFFENKAFASDLRFRDDEKGDGKLYLWSVPKGYPWEVLTYTYGYGGSTENNFDKAWIVKVNDRTYVNDLHKVTISEGDEITVYHVADVAVPWAFVQVHVDKDIIDIDETVTFTVTRFEQSLNEQRAINTLSSDAVEGIALRVNGATYPGEASPLRTDELGKAVVSFATSGTKMIDVGGELLPIVVRGGMAVGVEDELASSVKIYPNPFTEMITMVLDCSCLISYEIIGTYGNRLLTGIISDTTVIDTDALPAGIYLLRLSGKRASKTFKMIKR